MPKTVRELEQMLLKAGFERKEGRGSHRNYYHPRYQGVLTISGKPGDDAKKYQEIKVKKAVEEVRQK